MMTISVSTRELRKKLQFSLEINIGASSIHRMIYLRGIALQGTQMCIFPRIRRIGLNEVAEGKKGPGFSEILIKPRFPPCTPVYPVVYAF